MMMRTLRSAGQGGYTRHTVRKAGGAEVINQRDNPVAVLQRGFALLHFLPRALDGIPLAQRAAVSAVFQQGIEHLIDGLVQRAEAAAVDAGSP